MMLGEKLGRKAGKFRRRTDTSDCRATSVQRRLTALFSTICEPWHKSCVRKNRPEIRKNGRRKNGFFKISDDTILRARAAVKANGVPRHLSLREE